MNMESLPNSNNHLVLLTAKFIYGFIFIKDQLKVADLNPHEGRLRTSVAPEQFLEIPDLPPESSESI